MLPRALRAGITLKALPRTGWVGVGVPRPESVASHCYGVSLLAALYAPREGLDSSKCVRMALLHDLAEAEIGDHLPEAVGGMSGSEKAALEHAALRGISGADDGLLGVEGLALFEEFEGGQTPEARFVRECDKLDMLLQACRYEEETGLDLSEFFVGIPPFAFASLAELRERVETGRGAGGGTEKEEKLPGVG